MYYLELLWHFVRFQVLFGTEISGTCGTGINKQQGRSLDQRTSALIQMQVSRGNSTITAKPIQDS